MARLLRPGCHIHRRSSTSLRKRSSTESPSPISFSRFTEDSMSQFVFRWDSSPHTVAVRTLDTNTAESGLTPAAVRSVNKFAAQCRRAADAMSKHIAAKHLSANSMLAKPPTRKRFQDADSIRNEATRLERIQQMLLKLAEMYENGTVPADLASLRSRAAVESALFKEASSSPIHTLYKAVEGADSKRDRILRFTNEATLLRIPGFFPTPPEVADHLVQFAEVGNGMRVLEPSAGTGCLIDGVLKHCPQAHISYCELNCFLLDLLRLKYEGTDNVHFVGRDFEEIDPEYSHGRFDRIILNPPFERGQDVDHVLRAHRLLRPGGAVVGIVSEGPFARADQKAVAFREFLSRMGATTGKLPPGSFKSSGTSVQCRFVRIPAK